MLAIAHMLCIHRQAIDHRSQGSLWKFVNNSCTLDFHALDLYLTSNVGLHTW